MSKLDGLDEEELDLLADALDHAIVENGIDIAAVLLGERSAADLPVVGTGDDYDDARENATETPVHALIEAIDLPYHVHPVPRPGGTTADYYISTDEETVEAFAEHGDVTTIPLRELGEFFGYPEDAIDAFCDGDGNTLTHSDLRELRDEGRLTDDEARDAAAFLPYNPPEEGLDDHVEEAQRRRERFLEAADANDLPELRQTVEEARKHAFDSLSEFPLPVRVVLIAIASVALVFRRISSAVRRVREAIGR